MDKEMLINLVCERNLKKIENEFGSFSLGTTLGQGGTAIVREATLAGSTRRFAIKFLLKDVSHCEDDVYLRFKQAYINLSSIQHLGCCVPLLLMGRYHCESADIPYMIMARADSDLKAFIKTQTVSFEMFESVFQALLQQISLIHGQGIVHRDLKPENIFVLGRKLFLGDFDISKFDDAENLVLVETKARDRLGNYLFSAPEQSNAKVGEVCTASDWYAFAQIMIWIVTGQTIKGLTSLRLKDRDPRYEKFDALFSRLLQHNPKDRLQTGDEIKAFLQNHNETVRANAERVKWQNSLRLFDEIVHKYTCKIPFSCEGVVAITDRSAINDVLTYFRTNINELTLYLVYDGKDFDIDTLEQISDRVWRFGTDEICVESLFVYKHWSSGGNIVVVRGGELDAKISDGTADDYEEFAYFRGTVISRAEYDSGWANVNGEMICTGAEAKLVARQLHPHLYFVSPRISPLLERDTFEQVSQIGSEFCDKNGVTAEWLEAAMKGRIKRTQTVRMHD